ncbi:MULTISPECIES: hypothetical protein [unclassified Cryobacterium]|uniref:hypothetical protein n=1 Tax=unclassified Cryobacterium TaxID=2649013 RepID=UPI002AB435AF|nr:MULTISPECIES: hypothetical protein [unclassified Cryobacterium]MDY7542603.1 hypothetical protein [Cryobacterium sp. 5B3]MEB0264723.1 hypothetical protein [Cryobacterium sp. 10I5]MEB0273695.1 hypothetical protein [Cryobacterium sp. 5B3]
MARLRKKHLPHRIDITRLTGEGAEGDTWAAPVADRPAYVEGKAARVIDRRSTSPTAGQEIVTSAFIVLLLDDDVLPRSTVTVFKGTPRERTAEVISSAFFDYPRTPSHVELYI